MECPYCAEQIKDVALVCAHCGRDLTFFRPVMSRLDALEKRISNLEGSSERPTVKEDQFVVGSPWRAGLLAVFLTALIAVSSYTASLPEATSPTLLLISIFCPLPIAIALGFVTTRTHFEKEGWGMTIQLGVGGYAVLGLAAGLLTFGSMSFLRWRSGQSVITVDFWQGALLWVVGSAILFTGGGFLGRWLRKRKVYDKDNWTVRVANRLITPSQSGGSSENRDEQVKHMASVLTALAPILTLAGTIITGLFTYLATKK